jgi:hypothetical protein
VNSYELARWYLQESGGDVTVFEQQLADGLRHGQAFFNALTAEDQEKLRGSIWDPFYMEDPVASGLAITMVLTVHPAS